MALIGAALTIARSTIKQALLNDLSGRAALSLFRSVGGRGGDAAFSLQWRNARREFDFAPRIAALNPFEKIPRHLITPAITRLPERFQYIGVFEYTDPLSEERVIKRVSLHSSARLTNADIFSNFVQQARDGFLLIDTAQIDFRSAVLTIEAVRETSRRRQGA